MQVGFLIAGNDVHHVAHILPIADELARSRPEWQINILTTGKGAADEVERYLPAGASQSVHLRLVPGRRHPGVVADPQAVMWEADVVPWLNTLVVTRADLGPASSSSRRPGQKIIHLPPGGNDHAPADAQWAEFDHLLVAGEKSQAWLARHAGLDVGKISVVGCTPLETPVQPMQPPFATDGRKVVLYNPDHSPARSSWHRWGRIILQWFVEHDDHLLIFAPHPRLFERRFVRSPERWLPIHVGRLEERHLSAPNIHIDLGGRASHARAYADIADIYLGDGGGLLYEFIARPRPCAFLNAHGTGYDAADPRLYAWKAGHVIDDPKLLRTHLHTAQEWHAEVYQSVQRDMFAHSISMTDVPAAQRAAAAIERVIRG